ncbi:MAG: metallophosphoesterase [Ferruginibacter sp.]
MIFIKHILKPLFFLGATCILPGSYKGFYSNHLFNSKEIKKSTKTDKLGIKPCFLIISDIHLNSGTGIQQAADSNDDSGNVLWDSAKNKINKIIDSESPQFVIVLGDLPFHAEPSDSNQLYKARNNAGTVLNQLRDISEKKTIPLLFVPGNNDSYGGDYHFFSNEIFAGDSIGKDNWPIINGIKESKLANDPLIADASQAELGYYAAYPLGKTIPLRVIVMNTVMFNPQNRDTKDTIWNYDGNDPTSRNKDAKQQIQWLRLQLQKAKSNNEHVLIAMHIPLGKNGYHRSKEPVKDFWDSSLKFNDRSVQNIFLDLADSFKNNIIGILSGHTHMDGIRLLRNRRKDNISSLVISAPGIAPGHGNNPALKLIYYNRHNLELEDFKTFYMNYQENKQITNWDSSFGFRGLTNSATSMLKYVRDKRNSERIRIFIERTYSASSRQDPSKKEESNETIYVDYQK